MGRNGIGEFEELVLLAVAALTEGGYGLSVRNLLKEQAQRTVSLGAVHATLYRLEDKGYLRSDLTGASAERGGRRKRMFTITGSGVAVLQAARESRESLRSLIPAGLKPELA